MKKEPCIKLGMRIRPKIREKPDDNRNNSPPSARLLAARIAACAELIGVNIERSFSSQTGRKLAPTRRTLERRSRLGHGGTPTPHRGEGAGRACGIAVHSRNSNEQSAQQNDSLAHLFEILRWRIVTSVDLFRQ